MDRTSNTSKDGNLKWQIGDVIVTKILESTFDGGLDAFLPFATPEAVMAIDWLGRDYVTPEGVLKFSIHGLVIEVGDRRILVDTCVGNEKERAAFPLWDMQQYSFLEDLEKAGFHPDTIDTILCTHLHLDHVGWNTKKVEGRWVPTFPNARYLIEQREFDVLQENIKDIGSGDVMRDVDRAVYLDSVLPIVESGLVDFVTSDHEVCEEIKLVPTPGHTAGHVSIAIHSAGESALITGDFIHHPCQLAHPDWSITSDYDPDQSTRTREAQFPKIVDENILMIGTHWPSPTAGYITRDKRAYRLKE